MKKTVGLFLLMTLFIVGCSSNTGSNSSSTSNESGGSTSNNNQTDTIELSFNTWFPTSDPIVDSLSEWEKLVKEKTDGRIVVNSYHANALGTADRILHDVAGGVYEIGYVSSMLFGDSEMFPYTIANLTFALPDTQTGTNVMAKFLEKYQEPQDVEYLGIAVSDPYVLWSTKPIRSVEDVKGLNIRAVSEVQVEIVKSWGASPVNIPVAELYEGLQRGTIDGAVFSLVGGESWNYHEVAPYITTLPISTPSFIPAMNKSVFDQLPDDLKTLFKDELGPALAQVFSDHYAEYTNISSVNIVEKTNDRGEIINLSEDEISQFQVHTKAIWDSWVEQANAKGFPGDAMMEDFKTFIVEEGHTLPFE
ncbi:hypothetical protein BTR23_14815 [Alkalihalophilus pseudofirmus]|nr:hypothetical protein BTR23_14815 [Alkalihalophilus pseudofirmus]